MQNEKTFYNIRLFLYILKQYKEEIYNKDLFTFINFLFNIIHLYFINEKNKKLFLIIFLVIWLF